MTSLKRHLRTVLLGALTVPAFAPLQWFIIALITPALLERQLYQQGARKSAFTTFIFGLGFFGAGISWVFVSIHNHSDAPLWAALLITFIFVAALSGVLAMMGAAYGAFTKRLPFTHSYVILFPLLWVLFEWVRTWLFTGFPWLLLGYTLIDTPLQGFAPLIGVYGLSFLCVFIGVLIIALFRMPLRQQCLGTVLVVGLCLGGLGLSTVEWTHPMGEPKVFSLVQGNIPQATKWDPAAAHEHLETYRGLTTRLATSHVVVWPEAAFPYTVPHARTPLLMIDHDARRVHQALITGAVIADNNDMYTNSVMALGDDANGRYDKYHLVPFGEYVPFHEWLGSTFDWLQLPMSFTVPGLEIQTPLHVQGMRIAPLICYEVVYPELARLRAQQSDVLLTVSNDTWFGRSLGPIQHLQMARMRALENGRFMVRATNNGMTAIIDNHGKIRHLAPSDQATTLSGVVQPYAGSTPIMFIGHDTLLIILGLVLLGLIVLANKRIRKQKDDIITPHQRS